jgi:SAM-dependent methyltransferase
MLQLRTAGYLALDNLRSRGEFPPRWNSIEALEEVTDSFMRRFLEERIEASKSLGPGFQLYELLDQSVRSSETEHMDSGRTNGEEKLELVRALDRMNEMTLAYRHQIDLLDPILSELSRLRQGPVRVLELASGSGGLAFALAGHAREKGIDIKVTASDIVPETVAEGRRQAMENSMPVDFVVLNAFDFTGLETGSFDLVIVSQSLHHFTPGQLALMIARSEDLGASAFVGMDGHRSLLLLAGVPLVASLQGIAAFTGDGLTSARKFYSDIELDIIAGIATGKTGHRVECSWPMTILFIPFHRQDRQAE